MPSEPAGATSVSGRTILRALNAAGVIVIAIMAVNGRGAAVFLSDVALAQAERPPKRRRVNRRRTLALTHF